MLLWAASVAVATVLLLLCASGAYAAHLFRRLRRLARAEAGKRQAQRRQGLEQERKRRLFVESIFDPAERALAEQVFFAASTDDADLARGLIAEHEKAHGKVDPQIHALADSIAKRVQARQERAALEATRLARIQAVEERLYGEGARGSYRWWKTLSFNAGRPVFDSEGPPPPETVLADVHAAWQASEELARMQEGRATGEEELRLWRDYLLSRQDYRTFYKPERWSTDGRRGLLYSRFDPQRFAEKSFDLAPPERGFVGTLVWEAARAGDPAALAAALTIYTQDGGKIEGWREQQLRKRVSRMRTVIDYFTALETAKLAEKHTWNEAAVKRYLAEAATLRDLMRRDHPPGDPEIEAVYATIFEEGAKLERKLWGQLDKWRRVEAHG